MPAYPGRRRFVAAVLLLAAGWIACDTDTFTGYKYTADTVAASTRITGRITDQFTGEGVLSARVRIGGQEATTRTDGTFRLDYFFGNSEIYNAAIPAEITAENYLPLSTSLSILPNGTYLEQTLEYGAPIIEESSYVLRDLGEGDTLLVVEATVFDYQGAGDLDSVFVEGLYWNADSGSGFFHLALMRPVGQIDALRGRYEGELPDTLGNHALSPPRYAIIAVDRFPFRTERGFLFNR